VYDQTKEEHHMKGIITIAGYGTRFLPASKAIPKEMFPIAGVPLLQYHVEDLAAAGITEIIVVVRGGAGVIQQHFAPVPDLEAHLKAQGKADLLKEVQRISHLADIVFVPQPDKLPNGKRLPYGNASPALAARSWLTPGEPFYYMFGDDIIIADTPVPRQLLDAFGRFHPAAVVATQCVPDEETHLYGCIKLKPGSERELADIVEKPKPGTAPSNLVQVGHFVFTPELFDVLDTLKTGQGNELWLAHAVAKLASRSTVVAQPIAGRWMAAGDPLRHLKACIEVTLRHDDMRAGLVDYLRSLEL
jgi:UTP--glucose-1-phosphate uridylyltransferase